MRSMIALYCCCLLFSPLLAAADIPAGVDTGPGVDGSGPVFPVGEGAANDHVYKVSSDLSSTGDSPG